jgi:tetratricopeptide (TPR) repeat protein
MKAFGFTGIFAAGALLILSSCAPVATAPPRTSDGVIYDAQGNPIYVPNPQMPEQPVPDAEGSADISEAERREREAAPAPKPPPRIGGGNAGGRSGDGHLIAAVSPLRERAREQMDRGEYDRALATAERAIRIDGTNPELWQLMARIQIKREAFAQAEQLARKSNMLAGNNDSLRAENWRIIADSHSGRGDRSRADDARRTAKRLEGR